MATLKNTIINDTGHLTLPVGTTAQRPGTPANGMIRHNSSTGLIEMYASGQWGSVASGWDATGGSILTVGDFKIHTFTSSNTFTVTSFGSTIEVLVVGGGGAGGFGHGGGGGGGAVLYHANLAVTATNYSIVIGAGGSQSLNNAANNPGASTTAFGVTATGGGSGANELYDDTSGRGGVGGNGANSGGGSYGNASAGTATAPTAAGWTVYAGNAGARGYASVGYNYGCGGGGGAGGTPAQPDNIDGGNGGNGVLINIDGNNYLWAAGGGGVVYSQGGTHGHAGYGGVGGGGAATVWGEGALTLGSGGGQGISTGGNGTLANDGAGGSGGTNTGSGGGGGANENGIGGAGGSGIVIVRYKFR